MEKTDKGPDHCCPINFSYQTGYRGHGLGYLDYSWYKKLTEKDIYFVKRARKNMRYQLTERRSVGKLRGLRTNQSIRLIGLKSMTEELPVLRRVPYIDPERVNY